MLLLNKLKYSQYYYVNPKVSISHLLNAVLEPKLSPLGITCAITVKSYVRTFDCGANWQSLKPMVTAVFDYFPTLCRLLRPLMLLTVSWVIAVVDVVPTAPAFDVARSLWVIAVVDVVFPPC